MLNSVEFESREGREEEFKAFRISPESYIAYWPSIDKELDRVPRIWQDYWTKEYLYEGGAYERFQVWGFGLQEELRVIVFTQITQFPAARYLQIFLAFGNSLDLALPVMEATFETFARHTGCEFCEIVGRKGWARKLPRFKETRILLTCKVSNYGVH